MYRVVDPATGATLGEHPVLTDEQLDAEVERAAAAFAEWSSRSVAERAAVGLLLTGRDVPREAWDGDLPPASLATSVPGVFAAGDVRSGSMKRVAAASGEGASVVSLIHAHLAPEG